MGNECHEKIQLSKKIMSRVHCSDLLLRPFSNGTWDVILLCTFLRNYCVVRKLQITVVSQLVSCYSSWIQIPQRPVKLIEILWHRPFFVSKFTYAKSERKKNVTRKKIATPWKGGAYVNICIIVKLCFCRIFKSWIHLSLAY